MTEELRAIGIDRNEVLRGVQKVLARFAEPAFSIGAGETGVHVLKSQLNDHDYRFLFVTPDKMEVTLEFDFDRLDREGAEYIETRISNLVTQMDEARAERWSRSFAETIRN